VGAAALALDGKLLAHAEVGNLNMVAAAAFFPAIFLAFERLLERPTRRHAACAAALLWISFLGGHLQEWYYLMIALALLAAFELLPARGDDSGLASRVKRTACAALPVVLVLPALALWLVPAAELGHWTSRRSGLSLNGAAEQAVSLVHTLSLITPRAFGMIEAAHWGPANPWERYLYLGLLPLALVPLGVARMLRRRTRFGLAYVVIAVLGLAFAGGGTVFRAAFATLPGMSLFRIPTRMLFVIRPVLALFVAMGVDELLERRALQRGLGVVLIAVGAVLVAGQIWIDGRATELVVPFARWVAIHMAAGDFDPVPVTVVAGQAALWLTNLAQELGWQGAVALICALAVSALPGKLGERHRRWAVAGVLGALVLDLGRVGLPMIQLAPSPTTSANPPVLAELALRVPRESPFRVLDLTPKPRYTASLRSGIELLNVYDPVILDPIRRLTNLQVPKLPQNNVTWLPIEALTIDADTDLRPLSLLNVRYLITDKPAVHPRLTELVHDASGEWLYRFLDDGPRARWVPSARRFPDNAGGEAQVLAALATSDPAHEVLLLGPGDEPPQPAARGGDAEPRVEWRQRTANRVELETDAPSAGWLVLSQTFYPGWSALVDGAPTAIERAQLAFQAVAVEAGRHRVELRFAPSHIRPAAAVTVLGLLAIVACLLPMPLTGRLRRDPQAIGAQFG
jgi:hypothetical protein